jgi:hypothetical protein
MDAVVFYPADEEQLKKLMLLPETTGIPSTRINEEEKKKLAGILLAGLAKKNPKAYATMDEIVSVVEEVREEIYYGKKDNNS